MLSPCSCPDLTRLKLIKNEIFCSGGRRFENYQISNLAQMWKWHKSSVFIKNTEIELFRLHKEVEYGSPAVSTDDDE